MTDLHPTASIKDTILAILADVLAEPVEALHAEPVLAVHAWDSIASLEALVLIERQLGVALDLRPYHAARAVDDLVDLVAAARGIHTAKVRP
jgi:acyl carrier protein